MDPVSVWKGHNRQRAIQSQTAHNLNISSTIIPGCLDAAATSSSKYSTKHKWEKLDNYA